jgi:hypothetical protein
MLERSTRKPVLLCSLRRRVRAFALPLLAALGVAACGDSDTFVPFPEFGGPAGVLDGALTYAGPLPCTENGHVIGAAVVLAFDNRLLPPPEGLGVTAASIDIVSGDVLFAGARDKLSFDTSGARFCPAISGGTVTVSAPWALGPLTGAVYQIRGFYDRDGDFNPGFSISNLPSKGDVGGGAIDNADHVLLGAAPQFRNIPLGTAQADGTYTIPPLGARVSNVAVTFGLPLPLERPVFHVREVIDPAGMNTDPSHVVMPSDFQLEKFSSSDPATTESSFIRLRLGAGVPPPEIDKAAVSPFFMPVKDPAPSFTFTRQDVTGDGTLDMSDHIPETELIPALFPLSIFSKLQTGSFMVSQNKPVIVLQGLTLYKSLVETALSPPGLNDAQSEVFVAIRPAVLCLDVADPSVPGILLVSRPDDYMGNLLIADPGPVLASLERQFSRPMELRVGCLPEGDYAMNLIYGTGQAWSVPNEAGVCAPSEKEGQGTCGKRPRLSSQRSILTIGPPNDPSYCITRPTPTECLP